MKSPNDLLRDLGLNVSVTGEVSLKIDNLINTPWQNIDKASAIIRAMDNLISTYGEDMVLDIIATAYVSPGYEKP